MKNKTENIIFKIEGFLNLVKNSWTWEKLTEKEQQTFIYQLKTPITLKCLENNIEHSWETLNALYYMFLKGLGYENINWRE